MSQGKYYSPRLLRPLISPLYHAAKAQALLETYLRDTPIPLDERPEGVEVSVELDLAPHGLPKLVGIMDLVRKGGCIVDYKTTSRTPDGEKVLHLTEVQTTSYAMLYREATDRQESGIELHHLVRLKTPKLVVTRSGPASQEQQDRLLRMIHSYVRGLEVVQIGWHVPRYWLARGFISEVLLLSSP